MKKSRKATNNIPQINPASSKEDTPARELPPKPKYKKILLGAAASLLLAVIFIIIGWFIGHQVDNYNPYQVLKGYESSRHGFMVKSAELSVKMTDRALKALKNKKIDEAVEDAKIAIDLFPVDAKPYILLAKLYLMTGQEQKMFDILTLAGRSYPNFNNIVGIIDDDNLDRIPLEEPGDNVYLANFPENRAMALSYIFDDGESNVYKALPIFEKYGYKATIGVVAAFVSDRSNDPFWGSWGEWRDAANRGFEIANHSMFHRDSKKMHGADFDISIDQARDLIVQNTGYKPTAYIFPHDSYTDESVSRALRQHKVVRTPEFLRPFYNRTIEIVFGGPNFSPETGDRLIDIGIKRRLWILAKCHGVTDRRSMRSFKSITPAFLETNLAYIHSKANDVWLDTFTHVFDYLARRSQTKIEVKNTNDNSVDFALHTDKPQEDINLPMTVVIKVPGGSSLKTAVEQSGGSLKAWACAANKLCVDVSVFDKNVHVEW